MSVVLDVKEIKETFKNIKIEEKPYMDIFNTALSDAIEDIVIPHEKQLERKRAALMAMDVKKLQSLAPADLTPVEGSVRMYNAGGSQLSSPLSLMNILTELSFEHPVEHLYYEDVEGERVHVFKIELPGKFVTSVPFVHINDVPDEVMDSGSVTVKRDPDCGIVYLESWVDQLPSSNENFGETLNLQMEYYNSILIGVNEDTNAIENWVTGKFQPCSPEFWNKNPRKRDIRSQYVWFREDNSPEVEGE